MNKRSIKLGNDVELIIDEPMAISSNDRSLLFITAFAEMMSDSSPSKISNKQGGFFLRTGVGIYKIIYRIKADHVFNTLNLYNDAITHIKENPNLYDQRLACKAIEVLHKSFKDELR